MKKDKILLLSAEIDKCLEQLDKLFSYYTEAKQDFQVISNKKNQIILRGELWHRQ